jgi:hypothetical protein
MFFNRYFIPSFALLILIALLHYIALDRAYYWTVSWYDIMMHFLGGLWVALFIVWVVQSNIFPFLRSHLSFASLLVCVIGVGLVWEYYEIFFGLTFVTDPEYWGDTALDLVMDTVGGSIGTFISKKNLNV